MNRMMLALVGIGLMACCGCSLGGLSVRPLPERLPVERQERVDEAWDQFLENQSAIDRETILDAVLAHRLHSEGVDTMYLKSVKNCAGGMVVMESWFERGDESKDKFRVTMLGFDRREFRTETFTRAEMDETMRLAKTPQSRERLTDGDGAVVETDEEYAARMARLDELERRVELVVAAFPLREPDLVDEAGNRTEGGLVDPMSGTGQGRVAGITVKWR